ncbi:hypothetical protein V3C99_014873 [Haemonchus contortus]
MPPPPVTSDAKRPLVLAAVLLGMIFILIYTLITFPRPLIAEPRQAVGGGSTAKKLNTSLIHELPIDDDPFRYANQPFHRRHIPNIVQPSLYQVLLKIYLPWRPGITFGALDFTMDGKTSMTFTVLYTMRRIQLNVKQLNITSVLLFHGVEEIQIDKILEEYPQLLDVYASTDLLPGHNYSLALEFKGNINNPRYAGIFVAPYRHGSENRFKTATHLQPQEARSLFPCIDSPEAKARFDATVIHPEGTYALSNMKETSISTKGGWTTTKFLRSPVMSTYLFSMVVGTMPYQETYTEKGVRVRIYAEERKLNDTSLALALVPKLLAFFEDYFQLPYPLTKLDIYGVTVMKVAAMENWGLITVRQKLLLNNSTISTLTETRVTQIVLAHEIAHQWFGNLVTMKWWDDLWLNEGFASMIGLKANDIIDKTPLSGDELSVDIARAMRNDQMPNSMPVSRRDEGFDPETAFSSNTYKKATFIILMVERIVGEEVFRDGLRLFLNKFMYKNVDHTDLLAVLARIHGASSNNEYLTGQNFTLTEVIETWIYQQGFPVLHVKKRNDGKVEVTQEIYRHTPGHKRSGAQWKVPLFLRDPRTLEPTVQWLAENHTAVVDLGTDVVLDRDGRSFIRVRYDTGLYLEITARLHADANCIPVSARTRLMDDSFTLAEIGNLSYLHALNISVYLRKERAYPPIKMLHAHLDFLVSRLTGHPQFRVFQDFIITILEPLFEYYRQNPVADEELKLHEEPLSDLRATVFSRVCLNGYSICASYARALVMKLMVSCTNTILSNRTCNVIPPYLRQPVYATAVMYGDEDIFEFLHSKWNMEVYQTERERIWIALGASKKKEHIHRIFNDLFFTSIPSDLRPMCAGYVSYNHPLNHFISYVLENLDRITSAVQDHRIPVELFLQTLARGIVKVEDIPMFNMVIERLAHAVPSKLSAVLSARIRSVSVWMKTYGDSVINNATAIMEHIEKLSMKSYPNFDQMSVDESVNRLLLVASSFFKRQQ